MMKIIFIIAIVLIVFFLFVEYRRRKAYREYIEKRRKDGLF